MNHITLSSPIFGLSILSFGKLGGLCLAVLLTACQSLPSAPHLPKSLELTQSLQRAPQIASLQVTPNSPKTLAALIDEQIAPRPHLSGYLPISTGANAFAARSILSDMASRTIDAQYYIWHDDEAGQLMLKDLWDAAERGVKVRLLLDDMNGNANLDRLLIALATHPNVAVRVVNPFLYRNARPINYITNPARINRRMHNKSMTFDGKISIIGGRNIGDEYLNNHDDSHFADLDILLIGKVVDDIHRSFDDYWQSSLAFDIETLTLPKKGIDKKTKQLFDFDNHAKQNATTNAQALKTYRAALADATIGQQLLNQSLPFRFKNIRFVGDDADKLTGALTDMPLVAQLRTEFGTPKKNLSIISSYFVPTKQGVAELVALAQYGVNVQILTNSYDATDVGLVHAGYGHWRAELLRAGVRLFELKATAKHAGTQRQAQKQHQKDNHLWRTKKRTTTSLHAKVFAVDDQKVFIGSYNIDPRSAHLNTEMGVLIDDDKLAKELHQDFGERLLNQAYEVKLNGNRLEWHTLENGQKTVLTQEPNMQYADKINISLLSWLPIDWLL